MADQELRNQIGELTIETRVLSLALIHLMAREAKASGDAEKWLRQFADEIHASIDTAGNPPPSLQAKIEQARSRVDVLMQAVRFRISRE